MWLLVAAFLAHVALTLPWLFDFEFNCEIWGFMTIPRMLLFTLFETLLIGLGLLGLWLLCGKRTWLPAVLVIALTGVGIAQHYVMIFKSDIILPRDIFAMRTALSVSGQYHYDISFGMIAGIVCAAASIYALHCASVGARREPRAGSSSLPVNMACGLVCLGALAAAVVLPKYEQLGVGMEYWIEKAPTYYAVQGFLPTFIRCAQDLPIRVPGGYSDEAAEQLQAEYAQAFDEQRSAGDAYAQASAQWGEQKPSIIVVMDETFCDLSVFENLHAGYEGTTYVSKELPVLRRGGMGVSVFGGGTCNTEFEFLTGISLEALGSEKYPYSMYELDQLDSLPKQLSALGYETIAMHPNDPENWNRAHVYPALGFDRFLDISDFEGAEVFHNGVTDKETFKSVLDLLKESDMPQFIFDVTMQNHSGYDVGNIPADRLTDYHPSDFDDSEFNPLLNEFLSCMNASEEDLKWFVGELEKLDEPVLLVYFGDHHPYFSWFYNNAVFGEDESQWKDGETWVTHEERIRNTVYVMWANYDVAGSPVNNTVEDISPNYLAAQTLLVAGVPLTDAQKAQLAARGDVLSYNEHGYEGADGQWYVRDAETDYAKTRDDLWWFDYLHLKSVR